MKTGARVRLLGVIAAGAGIVSLMGLGGCATGGGGARVSGGSIVTLDDGDTAPSRFAGMGTAASFTSGPDTLTVLSLPLPRASDRQVEFAQATISNDVEGSNPGLAVSRDGMWGVVAAVAPESGVGAQVAVVSMGEEATGPRVIDEMELTGGGRVSAAFHPFEARAAVLASEPPSLTLLDLGAEGVERRSEMPLTGMFDEATAPTSVAWHPSGRFMAVTLGEADRVCFLQLAEDEDGSAVVRKWGNEVGTDPAPARGVFSPDGRFYISANMAFRDDEDVEVFAASGTLTIIRVADSMSDDAAHQRVGTARLPHRPHAIAMSPNGDRIVTVSRRGVDLTLEDRSERLHGTIVSTSFDAANGSATPGGAQRSSSLPSAVCFDQDGSHALVADFETSEIQVWRVRGDGLEYSGLNVGTGYGPHAIVVTP